MPADRAIATADEVISAAIDELVRLRPAALSHINHSAPGVYNHMLAAWRAQATIVLRRASQELLATRLEFAEGTPLKELVASEYVIGGPNVLLDFGATRAIGTVNLTRPSGVAGVIREGTKLIRRPDPAAVPLPLKGASYRTSKPVVVGSGVLSVSVPIEASSMGSEANIVIEEAASAQSIALDEQPFGGNWTAGDSTCAGGRDTFSDDDLRRLAAQQPLGRDGATLGSIAAGAVLDTGVSRFATLYNHATAALHVYCADVSWGSSYALTSRVVQKLKDGWLGFGGRLDIGGVTNIFVNIIAVVQLRSAAMLVDTSAIESDIRESLRKYFNDRPDWYTWSASGLRSAITRANPSILTCTSVTVADRNGALLTAPGTITATGSPLNHYYLHDSGLTLTFQAPS